MGKFLKRNKGPVLAASLVLLALVGGIIGTTYGLFRAKNAAEAERVARLDAMAKRQEAEEQRTCAETEQKKAETSEANAREQRTRAEKREEQAIDAVKRFRDAVANNPELKNTPALNRSARRC